MLRWRSMSSIVGVLDRRHILTFVLILTVYAAPMLYLSDMKLEEAEYEYSISATVMNAGSSAVALVPSMRILNLFPNATWQSSWVVSASAECVVAIDGEDNLILSVNLTDIPAHANVTMYLSQRLRKVAHEKLVLDYADSASINDISPSLKIPSIQGSDTWQTDSVKLRALADEIWESVDRSPNVLRVAVAVADWIGKNVDSADHDAPYGPVETYERGVGDCDDQAVLLVTLLRILGVPSYLQVGALWTGWSNSEDYWNGTVVSTYSNIAYHGWAMVYVPPWGWLPFDMTWAWRSEEAFAVTQGSPVLTVEGFPMLNVTYTDWVREGRDLKGWFLESGLTSSEVHSLKRIQPSSIFDAVRSVYPWFLVAVVAAVAMAFTVLRPKPQFGK